MRLMRVDSWAKRSFGWVKYLLVCSFLTHSLFCQDRLISASVYTPDEDECALPFLFHGDWGSAGENQTLIGQHMGMWAEAHNALFLIALGDNFYCKCLINP